MRTAQDYLGLITSKLATYATFVKTVNLLTTGFADQQAAIYALPAEYDLDEAVGPQLDAVGQWANLSREVSIPLIDSYFSWDTENLGWDQGYWEGPYPTRASLVPLPDEEYRFYLKIKIQLNYTDGTIESAQEILMEAFSSASTGTYVFADDQQDMTYTLAVSGNLPSPTILALIFEEYINVKPGGVLQNIAVTSVDGATLFGFDIENDYVAGWDSGVWGITAEQYYGN
jgi:hypothetical protein